VQEKWRQNYSRSSELSTILIYLCLGSKLLEMITFVAVTILVNLLVINFTVHKLLIIISVSKCNERLWYHVLKSGLQTAILLQHDIAKSSDVQISIIAFIMTFIPT